MKLRRLALALALSFALTTVAEAKKKPTYSTNAKKGQKARKAVAHKYKPAKRKVAKYKPKAIKRKG